MADCNKFNSKVPLFPHLIIDLELIKEYLFGCGHGNHKSSVELTESVQTEDSGNDVQIINEKHRVKIRKKKKMKSNYHSFNISDAEWLTTYNSADTSPGWK